MLYCRVATRKALNLSVTDDVRKKGFLGGMIKPSPSDPIFRSRLPDCFSSRLAFDSLVVLPDEEHQIHREIIVYDSDQVYPENVVWYKIASEQNMSVNVHDQEQLQASSKKCRSDALSFAFQKYAVDPLSETLAHPKHLAMSQLGVGHGLCQGSSLLLPAASALSRHLLADHPVSLHIVDRHW